MKHDEILGALSDISESMRVLKEKQEELAREVKATREAMASVIGGMKDGLNPVGFRQQYIPQINERGGVKRRIHSTVYFAYAGRPNIYQCESLKEFAAIHEIEYIHGYLSGWQAVRTDNERKRLHLEATVARGRLCARGITLSMFGYYLTRDYEPVPYIEVWDERDPAVDEWCQANDCIINNAEEAGLAVPGDEAEPEQEADASTDIINK